MDTIISNSMAVTEIEYPSLSDRVQSTFIDSILIIALMFVFASVLDRLGNAPTWMRVAFFFFTWGIYEPGCTALGCTLGNYMKGIRVRQASNTKRKINILQALLRYIVKFSLGWISFITIHLNPGKRAIHDLASGSIVMKQLS